MRMAAARPKSTHRIADRNSVGTFRCPLPVRTSKDDPWELVQDSKGPVNERWVALGPAAKDFVSRANTSKQRQLLAAIAAGPMRMAKISAILPGTAGARGWHVPLAPATPAPSSPRSG